MENIIPFLPYFILGAILMMAVISIIADSIRRARYERMMRYLQQMNTMNPYGGYGYPYGRRSAGTGFALLLTLLLFMAFGYLKLNYRSPVPAQHPSTTLDSTDTVVDELNRLDEILETEVLNLRNYEPDANQSQHPDTSQWEVDDGSAPDLASRPQASELTGPGQLSNGQAIQIASFGNWENALDNFSKEIEKHWPKYQVILGIESIAETFMYKILLGTFMDTEAAEAELKIIQERYPKAYLKDLAEIEIDSYTEQ